MTILFESVDSVDSTQKALKLDGSIFDCRKKRETEPNLAMLAVTACSSEYMMNGRKNKSATACTLGYRLGRTYLLLSPKDRCPCLRVDWHIQSRPVIVAGPGQTSRVSLTWISFHDPLLLQVRDRPLEFVLRGFRSTEISLLTASCAKPG